MRIRISHATTYRYDAPPTGVIQMLRLTPRNHDGQYVVSWRIDLSEDCLLHQHEDAFGNITHSFTAEGPFRELSVAVEGEVETQDTAGRRAAARSSAFRPACSCARPRSRNPTPRSSTSPTARARTAGQRSTGAAARADDRAQSRDEIRHRSDPLRRPPRRKPSRCAAASARTSPISSSRRRASSASRRAMSADISTASTA